MSQIKKKHIRSKTIWQIFMMFLTSLDKGTQPFVVCDG